VIEYAAHRIANLLLSASRQGLDSRILSSPKVFSHFSTATVLMARKSNFPQFGESIDSTPGSSSGELNRPFHHRRSQPVRVICNAQPQLPWGRHSFSVSPTQSPPATTSATAPPASSLWSNRWPRNQRPPTTNRPTVLRLHVIYCRPSYIRICACVRQRPCKLLSAGHPLRMGCSLRNYR
jgi:hypothetical protein